MSKKTNKTAHVLKLLSNTAEGTIGNPILNDEFKDEVIHVRSRTSSTAKKAEIPPVNDASTGVRVNIIADLVSENQEAIAARFKCCNCDVCMAELTVSVLNDIHPKYAYIKDGSLAEVEDLKKQFRAEVISSLVKHTIKLKSKPIHE